MLSHTYPYLAGPFLSPLVVPRFVRNPKLFLTFPYFARLTVFSPTFPDHPSCSGLVRAFPGCPGCSSSPRLFRVINFIYIVTRLSCLHRVVLGCRQRPGCSNESKVVPCPSGLFYIVPDRDRSFCASPDGPRCYQISLGFLWIPLDSSICSKSCPPP